MDSTRKIDILREIQKELEIRKSWKPFFADEYVTIAFDVGNSILHTHWVGYPSEQDVIGGCERMLQGLRHFKCSKALNDTRQVVGEWTPSPVWFAEDWFPRMVIAGLKKLAWICSASTLRDYAAREALRMTNASTRIKTFHESLSALEWLATTR